MIRVLKGLAGVVLAVAIGVPATAATAQAAAGDVVCAGTLTTTFSPGLTLIPTEQTVTTNEIDAPCSSASNPGVTSGQTGVTVHEVRACVEVATPGSGTKTFTWNTGQTSVFSFNRTVSHVGGDVVVTLTGSITQGLFAGGTADEVIIGPTLDTLKCLIPPGITSRSAIILLTIT